MLAAVGLEQGLPTSRPQIIVSARKIGAGDSGSAGNSNCSINVINTGISDINQDFTAQNGLSPPNNTSRNFSKSVIVRAKSSMVR